MQHRRMRGGGREEVLDLDGLGFGQKAQLSVSGIIFLRSRGLTPVVMKVCVLKRSRCQEFPPM